MFCRCINKSYQTTKTVCVCFSLICLSTKKHQNSSHASHVCTLPLIAPLALEFGKLTGCIVTLCKCFHHLGHATPQIVTQSFQMQLQQKGKTKHSVQTS